MTVLRYKGNKKYISIQVLREKKQQGTRYKENGERKRMEKGWYNRLTG